MRDLMTFVAIASGTVNIILFIIVISISHEWGVAKGRLIQGERDGKVKPIGIQYKEGSE